MTQPQQRNTGEFVVRRIGGEDVRLYVPRPLPPDPQLALTEADIDKLERANRALGRLDGLSQLLPDPDLFLYFYVRKEAVLSSQIEGTQSSLSDLLLFESETTPGVPLDDVQEVSRYVAAMTHGVARLREDFPFSLRLIREIHEKLLAKVRGAGKEPGQFRRSQNWIGGSRPGKAFYVPPPPEMLMDCLGRLEKFIHDDPVKTPTLLKAALVHVQFETIHPFLDGNGRLGRLLITLILCNEGALREPLLYLSLYFKQNRERYYELLQRVRTVGDWESWIRFFLDGVEETAGQAVNVAIKIRDLFAKDRERIAKLGRVAGSALRVHELLQRRPLLSVPKGAKLLSLSAPTVRSSLQALADLGIVKETSGRRRDRIFGYRRYLDLIASDTNV
ncbi:MAG TPA: Fic family protein [Polyangia bacterium]|nr:Fic family protein [Polyangia bacterium]